MTPQPGSTAGGSSVTITGTGIQPGATITIGGVPTAATIYAGSMYVITPPHAAGTVDVVVTSSAGQIARLEGGYTYVPPESFDFNGVWEAGAHETPIRFTIENNTLVSLSCGTSGLVVFSPMPLVINGEFSLGGGDGTVVTGRIVSASAATGTINVSSCSATTWYAFKQGPQ
jgi:IPT/TIG domain